MDIPENSLRAVVFVADHRLFFFTVTAITASFVAVIAVRLWRKALIEDQWILYFGLGFGAFAIQYLPPSVLGILEMVWPPAEKWSRSVPVDHLRVLASAFNNLFLLAAAVVLLWPRLKLRRWYWPAAFTLALTTVLLSWNNVGAPWHRVGDAAFSAVALGLLGFAFFTNMSLLRRRWLAAIALIGAVAYAILNVCYALSPPVSIGALAPEVREALVELLIEAERLEAGSPGTNDVVRSALDTSLISLAFFLKLLLAVGGFALIIRALVVYSPRALSEVLRDVSQSDGIFFSNDGIARAIARSFEADEASLLYRVPGLTDLKVASWKWQRSEAGPSPIAPQRAGRPIVADLPPADDGREGTALATGYRIESQHFGVPRLSLANRIRGTGAPSLIVIPIRYHGRVTGCLTLQWFRPHAFTDTAAHHAERLAELLSSAVESRRRLAAFSRWGDRLQESGLVARTMTSREFIKELAQLLFENLGATAVGVSLRCGFVPVWGQAGDSGASSCNDDSREPRERQSRLRELAPGSSPRAEPERTQLQFRGRRIGSLQVLWPGAGESTSRCVVSLDKQSSRAFAGLIVTALLEAVENGLASILNGLQNRLLAPGAQSWNSWFDAVSNSADEAGISWVVARRPEQEGPLGDPGPVAVVEQHASAADTGELIDRVSLTDPDGGVHHLLRLRLGLSRAELWLGIANPLFGPELQDGWPWRKFLEGVAYAADTALAHMRSDEEVRNLQSQTSAYQNLLRVSQDTAAFIHDMRNIGRSFQFVAQSFETARKRRALAGSYDDLDEDLIQFMLSSVKRLYQLADGLWKPSALDGKASYALADLIDEVSQLFQPMLEIRSLRLRVDVPEDLFVAIPSQSVHTALITLVSNSLDALEGKQGAIHIHAEQADGMVLCHVSDEGPGIAPEIQSRLFQPGTSTKDGTGGKGLFLARSRIQAGGGDIVLTTSSPQGARFTIVLPQPGK